MDNYSNPTVPSKSGGGNTVIQPVPPRSSPPPQPKNASPPRKQGSSDNDPLPNDPFALSPHSTEAEEATLGSILMNPAALLSLRAFLTADDFFYLRHSWIYEACCRLADREEAIDTRTVAVELRAHQQLDDVGGEAYLNYLPGTMPTALHAEVYGHIVERAAIRRRLLGVAGEIAQLAHDEEQDINEVIDQSESRLFTVTERQHSRDLTPMHLIAVNYYDKLEHLRTTGVQPGLPTGFTDIDDLTGGLQNDDLTIIAGRPGMGKSAFLLSVARSVSQSIRDNKAGGTIAYFSIEMGNEQLYQRLMAMETSVSAQYLRLGNVDDAGWSKVVSATGDLAPLPIFFDDSPSLNPLQLRTKCRRLHRQHGLRLVIVDYLQLMNAGGAVGRHANRVQEIGYISRMLKELARELERPVLAAAQLNRQVEQRQDKHPLLSDLRESGSIENDADNVWFLYRDEVYNEATEKPGEAEVILAKHRNGPTGIATLLFRKELTQFVNMRKTHINLNDGTNLERWQTYADSHTQGAAR